MRLFSYPAPVTPVPDFGIQLLLQQGKCGRHIGPHRSTMAQPAQLMFHHRHVGHRCQNLVPEGDCPENRYTENTGTPLSRQRRIERQCRPHPCHVDAAVENLLGDRITAYPVSYHHGHPCSRGNVFGKFEEICFPRQRPAVAGLSVHCGRFITTTGQFNQIHSKRIEQRDQLPGILRTESVKLIFCLSSC